MPPEKKSIINFISSDSCFDLQFRKDTRHERTNSPTYYRWKAQFVVTAPKKNLKILEKIKKELKCGDISVSKDQARFSVQKIDDITDIIIPYFRKNCLPILEGSLNNKKKDFELWVKGVEIIKKNKGKYLTNWKKTDLHCLVEIHKSSAKYKHRVRSCKWLDIARTLAKSL